MLVASALCDMPAAEHPIQATIYVSPEGTGSGSSAGSPCSLIAARDKVRKINGTMTGDIVVQLAGGVYRMTQPLELLETDTVHDSGTNGFDIIYQAAPGSRPVLSGGLALKNWTLFNKEKNIYRAQVPAGTQSRQLYVNGVRAERARGDLRPAGWFKIDSGWGCLDQSIAKWRNPSDIEIVSRSSWPRSRSTRSRPRPSRSLSPNRANRHRPRSPRRHRSRPPGSI